MGESYNGYGDRIPTEVKIAIEGINSRNELTYAVVMALVEDGDLSFSELAEILDVHSQSLSNALKSLETGGWVRKRVTDKFGDEKTGHYSITNFGKSILDGLYTATKPKYQEKDPSRGFVTSNRWKGGYVQDVQVETIEDKKTVAKESFGPDQPVQPGNGRFA